MLKDFKYDVGVDNNNFTPISFEQVKRIINKQVASMNKINIEIKYGLFEV